MRIVLLHNPRSGRGRNAGVVTQLISDLAASGIEVDAVVIDRSLTAESLAAQARGASALVVAGGDGSVHHAAPAAIAAGVPLYHYPLGTENLFAREFGSRANVEHLLGALARGRTMRADVAACNGRLFVLMLSVGFDAHVVERVASGRASGVRRSDYVRHALAEIGNLRLPPLTLTVDGRFVAREEPGLVIVANSAEYAARLNPCLDARVHDGQLDILFLPYRSTLRLAAWSASVALRMHAHAKEARTARARSVQITSPAHRVPHQLDGESSPGRDAPLSLSIAVQPRQLLVLRAED